MADKTDNKSKKDFFARLFDTQKEGKGVKKQPRGPLNFVNFFSYYGQNATRLMEINFLYVFGNFPFLFALYAMTGQLNVNSFGAASYIFPQLYGAMSATGSITPASMALFGVHGVQSTVSLMTTATYVFFALSLLIIFTHGIVNTGCTYLIRSLVRGDPIFFFSDFAYAIKKNFKQSMIIGILDCAIYGLLGYNIVISYYNFNSYVVGLVFYANIAILFLYTLMRFYIYLLLITFDLSTWKIYKNALIFAILNGKRNIVAFLGIACMLIVTYAVSAMLLPLAILIPMFILFASGAFMGCYAAWPKIKEIMIDPYYVSEDDGKEQEAPIFLDRT